MTERPAATRALQLPAHVPVLDVVQLPVDAVLFHKLLVRAVLHQPAVLEHQNHVRPADRR